MVIKSIDWARQPKFKSNGRCSVLAVILALNCFCVKAVGRTSETAHVVPVTLVFSLR